MDVVDLDRLIEGELYARGDLTLPRVLDLCRAYPALGEALLGFFWAWEALGQIEADAGVRLSGEAASRGGGRRR